MRPPNEIRQALRSCFPERAERQTLTWRDALEHLGRLGLVNPAAPSEARLVRRTVENMRSAGELAPAAQVRVQGSRRPMVAYKRAGSWATDWGQAPGAQLAQAIGGWR